DQSIDLCTGGSITINWTVEDICEIFTPNATYTLTPPGDITYNNPSNANEQSCDFADQTEVDAAFNDWVTAQSTAIAVSGGCSPILSNNSTSVAIPELCSGGTVTVEWTITDLCETILISADFTLTAPSEVTFNNPLDDISEACEFGTSDLADAQNNLDIDIATWVTNETARINGSFSGGCAPTVTNDFVDQSIDFCTGGEITITWVINDLCQTTNSSATYTYTEPAAAAFDQSTLPEDDTVECDQVPTQEALTASNSCGNINVVFTEDRTDGDCPNNYSLLRTWTAVNICGVTTIHTQTITVEDNTPPVLSLPDNQTAECSDDLTPDTFGNATAIDNCDDSPVISFEDRREDGECSGTFTIIRTWTAIDACGNHISAEQTITTSDTTAPEFEQTTLPGNIVVECNALPEAETLTATDNCGTASVSVEDDIEAGNCTNNYTIKRSYIAEDECGLTNIHVQTITVQDTTPPEFEQTTLPMANIVVECDNLPLAETLTATDNCGSAEVEVSDVRTDGNCPNNYKLARTWTATDECGLTTTHTQIITVQDTTVPEFVETPPRDVTVECDAIPEVTILTATDNCGDATVTVNDVITNGDCPSNYIIARTWTATDECGLEVKHTQLITVQDTTAPVPTTSYDEVLDVSCTEIPEIPTLEFEDNCSSNVIIEFSETNSFDENNLVDYEIIRTWTVRDACNNEKDYIQTLNVALDEVFLAVNAEDRCFDDGVYDLNNDLPETLNTNGVWELIEGDPNATLNGSIFDPTGLELSEDFLPEEGEKIYIFRYTTTHEGCISITEVTMSINADCVVLPCGENDITISTAITPNGDGFNETFDIGGVELCGFRAEVKIFNRWGALVYESNDYTLGSKESSHGLLFGDWDGTPTASFGSKSKLPNGTYYYIIKLQNSGLSPLTGPIYLGTK
ncbi:gliding motility-associated C-terminal domain-containing protein, partial [Flaviramulus aquimarinus]|uniref:gliding motility-associated C-terminal domain-containing protein n=1 Tax=Flaviramulus aquimarinus TaxID=1170456 RepID=UPI0031F14E5B